LGEKRLSTRPRGRPPRDSVGAGAHPGLSVRDPLQNLPPSARWVLQCARQILTERGFAAMTIENIALESRESTASIKRYFGGKSGLIEALFDSLVHDAYVTLKERVESLPPGDERIHTYLQGLYDIVADIDATRAIFEIAPHALRDPDLTSRFAAIYAWYRELTIETCGLRDVDLSPDQQAALASMILATLDGLAYQVALDPQGVDISSVFELLYRYVSESLGKRLQPDREPHHGA
jgi:AcrR family transcriptional regulator